MQKTFTLAEAQSMLPLLEPVLRSAMEAQTTIEQADAQMHALIRKILMNGGIELDPLKVRAGKEARESAAEHLQQWLKEIEASGAQLKDLEMGLLDFPCVVEGQFVLLCWKVGEHSIEHWHGVDEGFAGRKKIDPSMFARGKQIRVN